MAGLIEEEELTIGEKIVELCKTCYAPNGECVRPFVSLEFFPPRSETGLLNLHERMERLKSVHPLFADFTWGAGGSTADMTLELSITCKKELGLVPNMHLTCTNMSVDMIDDALKGCKANGIRNIVALRGDPPKGEDEWSSAEGGFTCALDLVRYIRKHHGNYFGISVAGYPEGHPDRIKLVEGGLESLSKSELTRCSISENGDVHVCSDKDWAEELVYLKEKVDAGSSFIITQMFFDPTVYGVFVKDCRKAGITVPIVPGIMCINAYGGFKRMVGFCKSRVPPQLAARLEAVKDNEAAVKELGVDYGEEMCRSLLQQGAPGLHLYTLNLEKVSVGILRRLGLAGEYDGIIANEDTAQMLDMIKSGAMKAPVEELGHSKRFSLEFRVT